MFIVSRASIRSYCVHATPAMSSRFPVASKRGGANSRILPGSRKRSTSNTSFNSLTTALRPIALATTATFASMSANHVVCGKPRISSNCMMPRVLSCQALR